MEYMDNEGCVMYATKVASPGASTSVVERRKLLLSYATEVASPENGATTLVVEKKKVLLSYATKVASPGVCVKVKQ